MQTEQTISDAPSWSNSKKIFFLFLFCYVFLYMVPMPLDQIPFVAKYFSLITEPVILFFGHKILQWGDFSKIEFTGSGDTSFDYVRVFTILSISVLLAPLIFIIDRKRRNYDELLYWITVYMRYYVGIYMLIYGFGKIFKSQFPSPNLIRLEQPYGESSPMGLLWTFMGYSKGYNMFAGIGQALGGFLLFFRRTTVLGAFVVMAVMANVVALNFFYDVPVKLFSSHLVLLCFFILIPYFQPLIDFFIRHKQSILKIDFVPFKTKWKRITQIILKLIFIIGSTYMIASESYSIMMEYGDLGPKPPLFGIYRVEVFVQNHDTIPLLLTNGKRWSKVMIDRNAMIKTMDGEPGYYKSKIDTFNKSIDFSPNFKTSIANHFKYKRKGNSLTIDGNIFTDSIHAEMVREDMPLINSGFNWINEYPYNR